MKHTVMFFFSPNADNCLYRCLLQNKETFQMAEKTIKPPAIKERR